MKRQIDINADLGEGFGNDAEMMPLISSCSIACGGHYGDKTTMLATIQLAKKYHVKIGAHPSFPDPDNFGRKYVSMTKSELTNSLVEQLLNFYTVCETEDTLAHHIKLHGALYNHAAIDPDIADAVMDAIVATRLLPKLYVPYGSVLAQKAKNTCPIVYEAFIDRRYNDDRSLVSRSESIALIKDSKYAFNQLLRIYNKAVVTTVSKSDIFIKAATFCIHGDHANSINILNYIHEQLPFYGIEVV